MIPAKIIEISDKVLVEYYELPEPNNDDLILRYYYDENGEEQYEWRPDAPEEINDRYKAYEASKFIAEVENVRFSEDDQWWAYINYMPLNYPLSLNQQVFIEPTTEGKVKIVKL